MNYTLEVFLLILIASTIIGCQKDSPGEDYSSYAIASSISTNTSEGNTPITGEDSLDFQFNWLPATGKGLGANESLDASPICGWIISNQLDQRLEIADQRGNLLGSINSKGIWTPLPGQPEKEGGAQEKVKDTHLLQLVLWIIKKAAEEELFMDTFRQNMAQAAENIGSSNLNGTPQSLVLLLGNPLALVRTSIKVELKDEVAKIPVQIIGQEKLNSGLIAFWIEDFSGQTYRNNAHYTRFDSKVFNLKARSYKTLNDQSEIPISMLIDPLGSVHATVGAGPAKSLQLSPDSYSAALKSIEIQFNVGPQLIQDKKNNYPLPQEETYDWSWLGQDSSISSKKDTIVFLSKEELKKQYPNKSYLWDKLVANKSLFPLSEDRAIITLDKNRLPLSEIAPGLFPELENFLNSRTVDE
jgi:hypothetical protein